MSEKKRKMLLVVFGTVVASFVLFTFLFTTYELIFDHTDAALYECGSNANCGGPDDLCSLPEGPKCRCKGPGGAWTIYYCWPSSK